MNTSVQFVKDFPNKKTTVTVQFKAPLEIIWDAFTKPEITDKWWAPKPYEAVTLKANFCKGGQWLYYMLSPEGEKHWCLAEFKQIIPHETYEVLDAFCDENGNINTAFPRTKWKNSFSESNGYTTVTSEMHFEKEEDMTQIFEMGFEQGYTMGLNQLTELLQE